MKKLYFKLNNFLVLAKRTTYASSGEGGERKLADGAKELIFKKGLYKYRDRYFGSNPFIGQEIVFYKTKPVWGMNYHGIVVANNIDTHEVYNFLKKALQKVTAARPYRGPKLYQNNDWKYSCAIKGSIENFSSREIIYYKNKKAYKLLFHGGEIE